MASTWVTPFNTVLYCVISIIKSLTVITFLSDSAGCNRLNKAVILLTNTLGLMGLLIKSSPPNSNPLIWEASSFKAVSNTISVLSNCFCVLKYSQTSNPVLLGIITSKIIQSGAKEFAFSMASLPSLAVATS